MKKSCLLLIVSYITCSLSVHSQVATQTNLLRAMSQQEATNYAIKKAQAVEWANRNGIPVTIQINGSFLEIQYIDKNGRPQYYKTDNINAAATISTNKVYSGGGAGLSLTGSGITVREWDAGSVLSTHQEFGNRVTEVDGASSHGHSTHVAGTILAAGVESSAKGMAFGANLRSFDWNSDVSEMASEAASGALISNHSYGWVRGWNWDTTEYVWYGDPTISNDEDYLFGFYDNTSQQWDLIAQNAPYFLICKAAGNDRGDSDVGHPADGPYDCIDQTGISKNILTVGAVNDIPGGYTTPSSVVMTSFSSWGPADDGRIKPDIVANGTNLYSTYNTDNSSYATMSGTSMATPSVAGSLALLQQHYYALKSSYMRSATAKALVIHTADEAGYYNGPDYMFGWGLMNTKNAALKISEDQSNDVISELNLNNGTTYTRNIIASGTEPLKVTIVWTDPAGTPPAPALDPITPMLVNDLDLRITRSGSTFYPWKLDRDNPSYPATNNSKNSVDNVEVVYVANPVAGGAYTITVDHAGTLSGGSQPYSMIISGITNEVPTPYITVTMPNGGEAWEVGSTHNITWTSYGTSGTLKIEYSTNNGTSWANILTSTPDDGSQPWTIPNAPSSNCLIRISDTDGNPVDVSNAVFSIVIPAPRTLIAHYPLTSNGNDITGNNNPMTLVNSPFQNGGIYCNGIYDIADPVNGCKVITPYSLTGFNINSFEISIDFMLTELFPAANSPLPVFVGGSSYRWIGFCHYYDQGSQKISLLTNNSSYTLTQTSLNLNQWYNAKIVYNGITAFLYLDNQLICSKDVTLLSNGDYNISATNYSNSKVFKGYLKDLKVSTIDSSPGIIITAPNGGENWQVGSSHNITWTSSGTSGTVKIEYSINNGTSWSTVIASTQDDGSHSWTIPNTPSTACLVRVNDTNGSPVDISNGLFTISAGTPEVPTAPVVGTIAQPNCAVSTGSVVLNGLPSSGAWTLTRSPGGVTTSGSGSSTTISGLSAGSYTYTVTNSSGFTSASSANIVINTQPLAPAAPSVGTITQTTCSVSSGSVVLNGLPSSGNWTLTRTPGSVTTTGTGTSTMISGLSAGTYTYTVTDAIGCTSGSSGNVIINTQPSTPSSPAVGIITQPTCSVSTGSVVLNGLPSSGTWTLTRTPGGITSTGTGTSTTISGMFAGTYTYTVTDAIGCTSGMSGNVVIDDQPTAPSQPGFILGYTLVCPGESQNYNINGVSGATSYLWTLPSGWNGNSTSTLINASPGITGGQISVSAMNLCGTSIPRTITVTVVSKPTVTTSVIIGAAANTAVGGGNIVSDGGASIYERGVCWSTQPNPIVSDSKSSDGTQTGAYSSTLTGLINGIYYHVRAYATNCAGISYGSDITYLHITTSIVDIQHESKILVYPNPVSGILNIEYQFDEYKEFHIINTQGSILKVQKIISPRQQLDFSNYEYGIYFLEFIKYNGETKRIKVLHH